tara:strand:- start:1091 stop:1564 length:474 start_codon:yes stop_codon:yes gene_type:complete
MAGTHLISSSLFIQSGSVAHFKNGINVTGSFSSSVPIYAAEFDGLGTNTTSTPTLNVGKSNEDGTFEEWTTPTNASIRITASGDFDGFCFIENADSTGRWKTKEKGGSNGLIKRSYYDRTYYNEGIYEYLIIANNSTTLQTVVKGTTVTVTNPIASS